MNQISLRSERVVQTSGFGANQTEPEVLARISRANLVRAECRRYAAGKNESRSLCFASVPLATARFTTRMVGWQIVAQAGP
ncbi:uncharacterized protein PITG_09686 [Phytophthora infestans T30-4]|uniref:Uncharacterized protein n=1 Tax=Phytophthora infestans (strain T30-4) TaxID=403677 RepID=D0NCK6_PHYIT|nr:uncharacterized protein PITG_09686 [Phytophthora infestans T30-4]EEY55720.1 hypothetical protein PITG_09686 [Phytophthora infestans T30-4]|eukprot:XP_002903296.1 hypothetical protein PITG_09686 [Phytophthora infestans T30-4]